MRAQNFDVQELINSLQGTCTTIDEHLPEGMDYEDLTTADFEAIDNEIFRCSTCDWWCEICMQHSDGESCDECFLEEN